MDLGRERFLPWYVNNKHVETVQVIGDGDVFQLHGRDGQAALEQRHGQAINMAKFGIARRGSPRSNMSESLISTPKPVVPQSHSTRRLLHVVERVQNRLQFGGVGRRNGLAILAPAERG